MFGKIIAPTFFFALCACGAGASRPHNVQITVSRNAQLEDNFFNIEISNSEHDAICVGQHVRWTYEDYWGRGPYAQIYHGVDITEGVYIISPGAVVNYTANYEKFFAIPSKGIGYIPVFYCKDIELNRIPVVYYKLSMKSGELQ